MNTFCKYCDINCTFLTEENSCAKKNLSENISGELDIFIPEDCEHYGTLFLKLEEIKQKVRKYKEEIVYYEAMISSGCKEEVVYRKIINSLEKFIKKYEPFGAEHW